MSSMSCSKVHWNIVVWMYGTFGPQFLSMKSIHSSQFLSSGYNAWSYIGDARLSLLCGTRWMANITTMDGNSRTIFSTLLPMLSPKPSTCHWLSHLWWLLNSQSLISMYFKSISIQCWWIHSALSKCYNCRQFSNVTKESATAVSRCRVDPKTVSHGFAPRQCPDAFSPKPCPPILSLCCPLYCSQATQPFWQIASGRIPMLSCWLGPCLLHGPSLMNYCSHHLRLYSSKVYTSNEAKSNCSTTSVFWGSTAGKNRAVKRLLEVLQGLPEGDPGGVELENVSWMTGWIPGGAAVTHGAHGDNGSCPEPCRVENISDAP